MGKNTTPAKATAKPAVKAASTTDPRQGTDDAAKGDAKETASAPAPSKRKRAAFDEEAVSMSVHTAFNLTDDLGIMHRYEVGIQDMPKSHAEHFYTKPHADSNEE